MSQSAHTKVSWSIDADVLAKLRERVPRGKASAYASEALRRQLELDALDDLVAELSEQSGRPVDDALVQLYLDEMR